MYLFTENAVVVSDDGKNVKFQGKCPKCGAIDYMVKTVPVSDSGTNGSVHCCSKCGQGTYYSRMIRRSYNSNPFN